LYEELAKELGDEVVLAHVDIDDLAVRAKRFPRALLCSSLIFILLQDLEEVSSVRGVPTFRLYKSGSKVAEVVGANLDKVKAEIASHK
jgi:hypothetical protein